MNDYVQVPRAAMDAIIQFLSAPQNKFGKIEADASLTSPIQNLAREYQIGSCVTTIEQVAKVLSAIASTDADVAAIASLASSLEDDLTLTEECERLAEERDNWKACTEAERKENARLVGLLDEMRAKLKEGET